MARKLIRVLVFLAALLSSGPVWAAVSIPFTITLSEAATVTGTPRVAVDVGGSTRYAVYSAGSGTNTLTFTLSPQAGDVDLDGLTVSSPIDLNGGTIKDLAGNDLTLLTFTPPNTNGIKIDYPSLSMDFVTDADGRYTLNGTAYNDLASFLTASGGTFSRASIGSYYDSSGVLQTAASGAPRFDWDPVTHAAKGILIEESRTNIISYSDQFENAVWSKNFINISANSLMAPTGTSSADKLGDQSAFVSSKQILTRTFSVSPNTTYVVTIFVKAGEYNYIELQLVDPADLSPNMYPVFNISTGTVSQLNSASSPFSIDVGNGWKRIGYFYTTDASQTQIQMAFGSRPVANNNNYNGITGSGIYIWGVQLEQGSFVTSYIPTTSVAVTRAADDLTVPASAWVNNIEGVLFAASLKSSNSYSGIASIDNGTNTNFINHLYLSNLIYGETGLSGSIIQVGQPALFGQLNKAAFAAKAAMYALSVNGQTVTTSGNSQALPSANSKLWVGVDRWHANYFNGNIQLLKYYPHRLSNTQLQLLTQ